MGSSAEVAAVTVAPRLSLPVHHAAPDGLARTGLTCLLIANATLFTAFLFAVGVLSVIAPNRPPPPSGPGIGPAGAIALMLIAILAAAASLARRPQAEVAARALPLMLHGVAAPWAGRRAKALIGELHHAL